MSKPNKKQTDDGIKYADEFMDAEAEKTPEAQIAMPPSVQPLPSGPVPEMTVERNKANQIAAKAILKANAHKMLDDYDTPKIVATPLTPEEQQKLAPKAYRVLADKQITRGAGACTLRAGKVVTANEYDIPGLRSQGVQLEEVQT